MAWSGLVLFVLGLTPFTQDVSLTDVVESPVPDYGAMDIETNPPGAKVFLDDVEKTGVTPIYLERIPEGWHTLRLEQSHYEIWEYEVYVTGGWIRYLDPELHLLCDKEVVGDPLLTPTVAIQWLEDFAGFFRGIAMNVDPLFHQIVLWVFTDAWYIQPWGNDPWTEICDEGHWESWSHSGDVALALVVDSTYVADGFFPWWDHPADEPGVLAWDEKVAPAWERYRHFDWSSFQWSGRIGGPGDPSSNYWAWEDSSTWVDPNGLHLTITQQEDGWKSSAVQLLTFQPYGAHEFRFSTALDALPREAVFSVTIDDDWWDNETLRTDFGTFQGRVRSGGTMSVSPSYYPKHTQHFVVGPDTATTLRIETHETSARFLYWRGHDPYPPRPRDVLKEWSADVEPLYLPDETRVRLWLWQDQALPPSTGEPVEVVISSYAFIPD